MDFRSITLTLFLFIVGSFLRHEGNPAERESTIMYSLIGITNYLHYSPKEIDDNLSMDIYADYITDLDESKRYFLQSEINQLSTYKRDIDNQIDQFDFEFFNKAEALSIKAISRAEGIFKELIQEEFDIEKDAEYETDGENKVYAKNVDELKEEWRNFLQYSIISKIYDYQNDSISTEELKIKAQAKTKELYEDWFDRMSKVTRADRFDRYVNIIMEQFDPHSTYLTPKNQENFEIQMGNKLEGIGAQLAQDGDFVRVKSIVPGGPAWKGEELEEEDLIIEVKQDGEESVDIAGMRIDDVIRLIRGDKGTKVTLKVRRAGGVTKSISIIRDEIILEDALARSAVLSVNKQVENIGYIHLPLFYGTFDGGKSCAQDVATEIEKLKKDGVNGIVLDLRYNRGGALQDAIDMTGLFIEEGPVVQVRDNKNGTDVYKDENPHVLYDGPLIVLVNNISASSSEIVAGALQDYKRAVIVGGPKTYGKGTVQGLFDLDRVIENRPDIKPLGQVKLTVQKFYRISGKSNQLKGIIPDISIPDEFYAYEYGEDDYEDALGYDEIKPLKFNQDVYKARNLDELRSKSNSRVEQDARFNSIKSYSAKLSEQQDDTKVDLTYSDFAQEIDDMAEDLEELEKAFSEGFNDVLVRNASENEAFISEFDSRKEKNMRFLQSLLDDVQLRESLFIMKDMIAVDKRLAQK